MLFNYYNARLTRKPENAAPYQYAYLYKVEDLSVAEIAGLCKSGITWRAGIYKEGAENVKKENVIGSQIISLDFDMCEKTPYDIAAIAEEKGIPANLFYYTLSQGIKPNNNFRVMWCLDEMLDPQTYENAVKGFMEIFKEYKPDKACKDVSRMWYGGNSTSEVLNPTPLGSSVAAEQSKLIPHPIIYNGKGGEIDKNFSYDKVEQPAQAIIVDDKWCEALMPYCELWRRWCNQEYLDYNERLKLWTNLKYIKYNTRRKYISNDIMKFLYTNPININGNGVEEMCDTYVGHTFSKNEIVQKFRQKDLYPFKIVYYNNE